MMIKGAKKKIIKLSLCDAVLKIFKFSSVPIFFFFFPASIFKRAKVIFLLIETLRQYENKNANKKNSNHIISRRGAAKERAKKESENRDCAAWRAEGEELVHVYIAATLLNNSF
jgi:hypothetical protein